MKVYISGGITNNPNYVEEFKSAEELLSTMGYEVVNPTTLDPVAKHFDYAELMMSCLQLLRKCEAIYFLSSWTKSDGAKIEKLVAKKLGLKIIHAGYSGLTNPNRRRKGKTQTTIIENKGA